jgi:hypothetical protein
LAQWFKGDAANGVQIQFGGTSSVDGKVEISGQGAGLCTVGAAINDMLKYLERRQNLPKQLMLSAADTAPINYSGGIGMPAQIYDRIGPPTDDWKIKI